MSTTATIAENVIGADPSRYSLPGESHLDCWVREGAGVGRRNTPAQPAVGWEETITWLVRSTNWHTERHPVYGYSPAGWLGAPYEGASSAAGSLEEGRHLRAARQAFADIRRDGGSIGAAQTAAAPHIRHALDVRRHVESIRVQVEQSLDESIAAEAALMTTAPGTAAWDRALERRIRASARSAVWRRAALTGALTDTLAALAA